MMGCYAVWRLVASAASYAHFEPRRLSTGVRPRNEPPEAKSSVKRVAIEVVIAVAFGIGFSLLIEVGIPLVLKATGAKRLVPPQPPSEPPAFPHFHPPKVPTFVPR